MGNTLQEIKLIEKQALVSHLKLSSESSTTFHMPWLSLHTAIHDDIKILQ